MGSDRKALLQRKEILVMRLNRRWFCSFKGAFVVISICFVLICNISAQASDFSVSFTTVNIGELRPPVSENSLIKMGYPIQEFDYFDNSSCKYTIKPESYIEFDWDKSSLARQYVTSVTVYEYSALHSERSISYYSTYIPDALSYSAMVLNENTDVIEIELAYSVPQSDGSARTGWVGAYYVIQKDPYNVTFKNLDSNGNIIPGYEGTMYRMYNVNSGEHFYTADVGEANYLLSVGWNYESYAWRAPTSSNTPVYRLFNPASGEHHYTTSLGEKDYLTLHGWNYEGVGWYSADYGQALYRLYNPNDSGAGSHHYTTKATERDWLVACGWNYEGIGWYGL